MRISPVYAARSDLSTALKWKFTVEDRIRSDPRVRRWYWGYAHAKPWLRQTIDACLLLVIIVPFLLAALCQALVGSMFKRGSDYDGAGGLILYAAALIVLTTFAHPLDWVLLALTVVAALFLWWICAIFDPLEQDLRHVLARGVTTPKYT